MRAVLDVNVVIAAALSPSGAPAKVLAAALAGDFEIVTCEQLLGELRRALGYRKLRARITEDESDQLVELLRSEGDVVADPGPPRVRSSDPDDDYLIALADESNAAIVSGDSHLLDLAPDVPVYSPAGFLDLLSRL